MEYFTTHSIEDLREAKRKHNERYINYTPFQAWKEISYLTHLFRTIDGVDEDQSKALYEIEEMCSTQLDSIRFPKKK